MFNAYLLFKFIMEKRKEVTKAIGAKPYKLPIGAIEDGFITKKSTEGNGNADARGSSWGFQGI
jgi:hypothetical protein